MASTVALIATGDPTTIYLHGTAVAAYSGSGTPWTSAADTPFEIGNNDVTGPRFVIPAPPRTPVQSGGPPFAPWLATRGLLSANRTISLPIQARATTAANLTMLAPILRAYLFDSLQRDGLYLQVAYGGATLNALVESGQFQETDSFWNDEDGRGVMRGVLTLECRIGSASDGVALGSGTTITNAVANTSLLSSVEGDWRFYGQPLELALSGGDIGTTGTKTVYCAITQSVARNSSSFAENLITSSTSGATATGTHTGSLPIPRAITTRLMAYITSPSSNLQVRGVARLDTTAGQAVYIGPWVTPGTSNIIVDLGAVKPSYTPAGTTLLAQLQYRSTTGGATSGALVYLYLLNYYTFCAVTPPASTDTNGTIYIASASPGVAGTASSTLIDPLPHDGVAVTETGSTFRQRCAVAGSLPVAIRGAGVFLAWVDGGVFDNTDTISMDTNYLPLYETIAEA